MELLSLLSLYASMAWVGTDLHMPKPLSFNNPMKSIVKAGINSRYSNSLRARRSGDRIPVGMRFSAPVQTGSEDHPASYTMCTESFPGVKRQGRGVDHPPNLAPRLKKE